MFRFFRVRKEDRIIQALEENAEPFGCFLRDQFATWQSVQSLAIAGASDLLPFDIWKGVTRQKGEVWDMILEIQLGP